MYINLYREEDSSEKKMKIAHINERLSFTYKCMHTAWRFSMIYGVLKTLSPFLCTWESCFFWNTQLMEGRKEKYGDIR